MPRLPNYRRFQKPSDPPPRASRQPASFGLGNGGASHGVAVGPVGPSAQRPPPKAVPSTCANGAGSADTPAAPPKEGPAAATMACKSSTTPCTLSQSSRWEVSQPSCSRKPAPSERWQVFGSFLGVPHASTSSSSAGGRLRKLLSKPRKGVANCEEQAAPLTLPEHPCADSSSPWCPSRFMQQVVMLAAPPMFGSGHGAPPPKLARGTEKAMAEHLRHAAT
mmetsp:Transcript_89420/g.289196  ORF Transcript_89420/g.289196 Transcript_89420/m.289196 type:complete len:221 (-) Transcript_89420:2-664(-)